MTTEAQITAWLATQQDAMLAELKEMVNTDGGSYDKAGVDRTGAQVKRFLEDHGIAVEVVPREKHGDCLRGIVPGAHEIASGNQQKNIVLMGHRDTVFPKGEPERRPFTIQGNIAYGPGVADMKAGIVMNMFVLAAFHKFGGAPGPLVGLFTGDEEIGSPEGRPVIENEARSARVVFNSEPGRPSGNVVTGRKGGVFSVVDIEGKAAHSGGNFEAGISAIGEAAQKIVAIHALTDLKRGITLNVGLVGGGHLMVTGAVDIAKGFGISEAIIGLTIVSVGTSVPELATSLVAAYRKNSDIAMGNVVGSNIFNIFFILGSSAFVAPLPFQQELNSALVMCIVSAILLFFFMFVGKPRTLGRLQGFAFVLIYAFYTAYLILQA